MTKQLVVTLSMALVLSCGTQPTALDASIEVELERPPIHDAGMTDAGVDAGVLTGWPCDVRDALQTACARCHVASPYIPTFTTRADFLGPLGLEAAYRVRSGDELRRPMPPGLTFDSTDVYASQRATLLAWFDAGMPAGACDAPLTPP